MLAKLLRACQSVEILGAQIAEAYRNFALAKRAGFIENRDVGVL